jgi:hypothetical protein
MEARINVARNRRDYMLNDLPVEIISECRRMAREIRAEQDDVRDKKILAARIRMCSGYYDSDMVIRAISSRLLSEITSEDVSS